MSRRNRVPACAACKLLPAVAGSVMCQGCRNQARRLVAEFLSRGSEILVRSPPGSGWR